MDAKIIEIAAAARRTAPQPPLSDFWFAQVDLRLGRIERMIVRLEWQVWITVCACAALLLFETVKAMTGASS